MGNPLLTVEFRTPEDGTVMVHTLSKKAKGFWKTTQTIPHKKIWSKVWNFDCIPKFNFFFWLLVHNKILTSGNITKRVIEGPSRCVICNSAI